MSFDYSRLMKCSKDRYMQLQEEKKIDDKLKTCECEIVRDYLFAYREMNRRMSDALYNTSIFNTPRIFMKHMEKIDNHFNKLNQMNDICKGLPDIIKEM